MDKDKSYEELLEDALEMCEEYEDKLLPIYCYLGYCYGSMSEEEFRSIGIKDPVTLDYMKKLIIDGEELFLNI